MKAEQETNEKDLTMWEKFKVFLDLRSMSTGTIEILSFRLHLRETVEYLDVVHPSTECGSESICNLIFMVDHLQALDGITDSGEITIEIRKIHLYLLEIAESERTDHRIKSLDRIFKMLFDS